MLTSSSYFKYASRKPNEITTFAAHTPNIIVTLPTDPKYTNEELLELLKNDQETAINYLFKRDYEYLCKTSNRILKNSTIAEDIVQDVFYELWKKRQNLNVKIAIKAYLRRATINKTLNYIRDNKVVMEEDSKYENIPHKDSIALSLEKKELEKKINEAIDLLPPKARMVFMLSRFEQLSYKEIAAKLDISPKTVENHISKALKHLRTFLKPYIGKTMFVFAFQLIKNIIY